MKIAIAQINVLIGDFTGNLQRIRSAVAEAKEQGADIVLLPELTTVGYPPRDFLEFRDFIAQAEDVVEQLKADAQGIAIVVGSPTVNPVPEGKDLYNSAYFLADGEVKAVQHKTLLPTYDIFDEYRYFEPAHEWEVFEYRGQRIALTVCEDVWNVGNENPLYKICPMDEMIGQADIVVTATGNKDIVTADHMRDMKDRAILCNIGHFDNEIQVEALKNYKWTEVKPQVHEIELPGGKRIILLAEGRLVNLGCATGHPSFVMSASFTNQVIAQIELWHNHKNYENKVYVLPKHLDEKVATLHLKKVGAKLTKLSKDQADYISVGTEGPFKPDAYRY